MPDGKSAVLPMPAFPARGPSRRPSPLLVGLFLAGALTGTLAVTPALARDERISPEALEHFRAGVAYLQDQEGERTEEAYREFKAAYSLSKSPKVLGNMGYCAMKLERDAEAIDAYGRYLAEVADIDPEEKAQVTRDLQTLKTSVAKVSFTVDVPGASLTDIRVPVRGERVTNLYGPLDRGSDLGLRPGHHLWTVRLAGYEDASWEFDVPAGGQETHAFTMRKKQLQHLESPALATGPGPASSSTNVGPWIVMGLGGAMVAAGAVTGVLALGKVKDLETRCPGDLCPAGTNVEPDKDSARSLVRVTDVLLIGGGVVTAAGLTWWLLGNKSESHGRDDHAPRGSAMCTGAGCYGTVRVDF